MTPRRLVRVAISVMSSGVRREAPPPSRGQASRHHLAKPLNPGDVAASVKEGSATRTPRRLLRIAESATSRRADAPERNISPGPACGQTDHRVGGPYGGLRSTVAKKGMGNDKPLTIGPDLVPCLTQSPMFKTIEWKVPGPTVSEYASWPYSTWRKSGVHSEMTERGISSQRTPHQSPNPPPDPTPVERCF